MTDYSYIGTGKAYLRKVGAAAPLIEVGNASAITFGVTEDVKTLLDRTQPGGGNRNEVRRISSVDFSATLTDYSPENVAMGFFGDVTALSAGTATSEAVTVYVGGLNLLAHFADSITSVKSSDGTTTFDPLDPVTGEGDYALVDGGLSIPAGSAITDASNIKVTYAYGAKSIVEALTHSADIYEFYFPGFNEARESKRFVLHGYKVRLGAADQLAIVTDDFGNMTIKGTLLKDDTKPAGTSQYFRAEVEA